MKKTFYLLVLIIMHNDFCKAQNNEFQMQNYHPVSPSAASFLKYTELPVSEYTGIPNISIPLYEIDEDGIKIPLDLTYHAGGIRVSDEASWVGLGWDLQVGSIVQEVNDQDDYDPNTLPARELPDYLPSYTSPTEIDWRYNYGDWHGLIDYPDWTATVPIASPQADYTYPVSTGYYTPIDGNFNDAADGYLIMTSPYYDSEPDIFTASFLGHTVKFILNCNSLPYLPDQTFSAGLLTVLNDPTYKVIKTATGFEIIDGTGEQFYFEQNIIVSTTSTTPSGLGICLNCGQGAITATSSRTWLMTKIVTRNNKQILFTYSQPDIYSADYPSYSERWDTTINTDIVRDDLGEDNEFTDYRGIVNLEGQGIGENFATSVENRAYLSSIIFPNGEVDFSTSPRNDLTGAYKLDSIKVLAPQLFKSFTFNYSYTDATSVGGNTYNVGFVSPVSDLRLQLLSVLGNDGGVYSFNYNQTPLPPKNSYAQDVWGFYNGQLNNTNLIPNPTRIQTTAVLPDNGNNNSASPFCSQAAMLTGITYPTGGTTSFEYELNQFNNYWVADSGTNTNQFTTGNGLRIHAINHSADNINRAMRTVYSYDIGKDMLDRAMERQFNTNAVFITSTSTDNNYPSVMTEMQYLVYELCAKGFYSTNALGSINGVGYDSVIKQDVDLNGNNLGMIKSYFFNNVDNNGNITFYAGGRNGPTNIEAAVMLPQTKRTDLPDNGSLDSIIYFDNNNIRLKKVVNSYANALSPIYYGAKIIGFGSLIWPQIIQEFPGYQWAQTPQNLIAEYPIYDLESLPQQRITTEYDAAGDSLVTSEAFGYDNYNQLSSTLKYNNSYTQSEHMQYYYSINNGYTDAASQQILYNLHRLSDVIMYEKDGGPEPYEETPLYSYMKHYTTVNNGPLPSAVVSYVTVQKNMTLSNNTFDTVTYDKYDPFYANPLQYTAQKMTNSLIWDYNGEYVTAEIKNAGANDVAYTSFEYISLGQGDGNWTFTGTPTPDATSPTGGYCYQLSSGNNITTANTLNASTTYEVSYWTKGTTPLTIYGTITGFPVRGKTINGWTYYEHRITGKTSIVIGGTLKIDELRLYPYGSQMTTTTYAPLIGITNQCDLNNKITYYQYDAAGRLSIIRDQDTNIIKKYCYTYAGQPTNCNVSMYYNTADTAYLPKSCGADSTGTVADYIVSAGTYTSSVSQAAANQLAQNDINANAQNYANANGSCILSGGINLVLTDYAPVSGFSVTYTNLGTGQQYTFAIPVYTNQLPNNHFANIPRGSYNVTFSTSGNTSPYLFGINCSGAQQTMISGTSATFYNVIIGGTVCNTGIIIYPLQN
jgi:hypothetical protein